MLIHVMDYELAWNINWNEIEIFLGLCCSSDWKFTLFSVETTRLWFNDNVIWPEKGMKWFSRVCVVVNCNECWGKYGVNIDGEISQLIYFLKWITIFWCNLRFRGACNYLKLNFISTENSNLLMFLRRSIQTYHWKYSKLHPCFFTSSFYIP